MYNARCDVDDARKDMQKDLSGKARKDSKEYEEFVPPKRHQVVKLTVYSELEYALPDTGTMSESSSWIFLSKSAH